MPPSEPNSSRTPLPRTVDSAHERLDEHDDAIGEIKRLIGVEPQPVSGIVGSGLMLFLSRVYAQQEQKRERDEAEAKTKEKWRWRWTLLATIVGVILSGVTLINAVRGWVAPQPRPSPSPIPSLTAKP